MSGIIAGVVLGILLIDLLIHIVFALVVLPIFDRKMPFHVEPSSRIADTELIEIPTTDNLTLRGSLYRHEARPARGLIVFCPELDGNHWSAMSYCEGLWQAGFDVLSFDFRNQGESDHLPSYAPVHWLTDYEVHDVLAALTYARQRDDLSDEPLGLFGISRGGSAALTAAALQPDVHSIACEGAFSMNSLSLHFTLRWASLYVPAWMMKYLPVWHLRATLLTARMISQWRRGCRYTVLEHLLPRLRNKPVLMIAGERDTYVLPEISEMLREHINTDQANVWVVPHAKHNKARQTNPEAYDGRLVAFFSQMSTPVSISDEVSQPEC